MAEVDLNLLPVFDALMELRSVTQVADRLALTQPAVSHALGRLRRALDDPLFIRSPGGLMPTARAERIAPEIKASLKLLRDTLAPSQVSPAFAVRNFTIAAGNYFCGLIVPSLLARLRNEAPSVSLRFVPLIDSGAAMLDRGLTDLAFESLQDLPSRFVVEPVLEDDMVWIASRSSSLGGRKPDLEEIMRQPRLQVASFPRTSLSHDAAADCLPAERYPMPTQITPATVYDWQTALAVVASTDMIACIPRRIAEGTGRQDETVVLGPATPSEKLRIAMISHARNRSDSTLTWLRELIMNCAAGFD